MSSSNSSSSALKVVVVGGGNSTPIFATLAKTAGHHVTILTRRPQDWAAEIGFQNEDAGYLNGVKELKCRVDLTTSDPALCVPEADLIFLAGIPVHHNEQVLRDLIRPHLSKTKLVHVGSICA